MNNKRVIGIILLIVGVILLVVGINAKDSFADRWSNFFTGHYTDETVWFMIGGIALAITGLSMGLMGGRKGSN